MKYPLRAVAVAATCLVSLCGLAQAQSSVTVYGVADLGMVRENNGSSTVTRMDSGILNGSRLGFKGTEDLGGGLSALFQIESGISMDTGAQADAARLFNRLSFVGLGGAFGTIKLGRQNNPIYANVGTFDPFSNGMAGDAARLISFNGSRTDNVLSYGYAARGFRGELQYGVGEVAGKSEANRTVAGFGGYRNETLDVLLTYQNIRNGADTAATRVTLLGGNYNFGPAKVYAAYAWEQGVVMGSTTRQDQRDALLGLSVPAGPSGTVLFTCIVKTDKLVNKADARMLAIGYKYDLSKRTVLYTSYGQLANDDVAKYKVVAAGKDDRVFNAGIRHNF